MKKIISSFLIVFILLSTISCKFPSDFPKSNYQATHENTILSKEACIHKLKELLSTNELYFFDCDFSNSSYIKIIDSSFNISITGKMIYDEQLEHYVIDLEKYADVYIVANYRIESSSTCFGFSIYYSVLKSGGDIYRNDELIESRKSELYTQSTFKSIRDLIPQNGNGVIYFNSNMAAESSVPKNFYPADLESCVNPIIGFIKYNGSGLNLTAEDWPIKVVTHYLNHDDHHEDDTTMEYIVNYISNYAIYSKH